MIVTKDFNAGDLILGDESLLETDDDIENTEAAISPL